MLMSFDIILSYIPLIPLIFLDGKERYGYELLLAVENKPDDIGGSVGDTAVHQGPFPPHPPAHQSSPGPVPTPST